MTGMGDPEDATAAMINAILKHQIVLFGEAHGNKQEYEWLCKPQEYQRSVASLAALAMKWAGPAIGYSSTSTIY